METWSYSRFLSVPQTAVIATLITLRFLCPVNIKRRPKFLLTSSEEEEKKKRKRNSDYLIDTARSSVQIQVGTRDIEAAFVWAVQCLGTSEVMAGVNPALIALEFDY